MSYGAVTKASVDEYQFLVDLAALILGNEHPGVWNRLSVVGKKEMLRELVQAGAIGLEKAKKSYDPSYGAKFDTWAHGQVRFAMKNYINREFLPEEQVKAQLEFEFDNLEAMRGVILPDYKSQKDRDDQEAIIEQVYRLMERLPKKDREQMILRYVHEKPVEDIALIYGETPSMVYKTLDRSMQRLRSMVAEEDIEPAYRGYGTPAALRRKPRSGWEVLVQDIFGR